MVQFIKKHPLALRWHYTKLVDDFGWKFADKYFSWTKRRKLKTKHFTIISNDCVAGVIYHRLGMQYLSPTVWTYIFPDEYLRFLGKLKWYLQQPLRFTDKSKHTCAVYDRYGRLVKDCHYPVGVLGGDVEIHFLHSKTKEDALNQWNRRVARINYENLFALFVDNAYYDFIEEYFAEFDLLPLGQKLFVSKTQRSSCPYAVQVTNKMHLERNLDLVKWLNCDLQWQQKTV